jgi:hypothetical protein
MSEPSAEDMARYLDAVRPYALEVTRLEAEVARLKRLVGKAADAISATQEVLDSAEDAESAAGLLDIIQRARAALEGKE